MRKKEIIHVDLLEGFSDKEDIIAMFNPTVEMASELMNVPEATIQTWLTQEHYPVVGDGHLTNEAIDFLATEYVSHLHTYFDTCILSWDIMDKDERRLFDKFRRRFSNPFFSLVTEWKDIDTQSIARVFVAELFFKAFKAFSLEFDHYLSDHFTRIKSILSDLEPIEMENVSELISVISHSCYYGTRVKVKTKLPTAPDYRNILLEILQENRFHIFSGETEFHGLFEAILNYHHLKQPQIAIAPVFGYPRHKNTVSHEKDKAYRCC